MDIIMQISNSIVVPQRVILSVFGFLAIVNAYTMRYSLDIALRQIVICNSQSSAACKYPPTVKNELVLAGVNYYRNVTHYFFKRLNVTYFQINIYNETLHGTHHYGIDTRSSNRGCQYDWSDQMQTVILTSFYVGYVLSHIPGGLLATNYGGKWILGFSIGFSAILTLLTPATIVYGGPIALIILRILLGLSIGPTFPALTTLLSHWVPKKERGTLGVLALSGGQVGVILVNVISSVLNHVADWKMIFYCFGVCGLIWFIGFIIFCYNDPESNPYIKESEKLYLCKEIDNIKKSNVKLPPTPWKDILQSPPVWALISSTVQYDWTQVNLVNYISSVLRKMHEANSSLSENLYSSLTVSMPYIINWIVSLLSGALSDILINWNIVSITDTRRLMASVSALSTSFFTSLASCFTYDENNTLMDIFNCALGVMGAYYAGIKLSPLDLSPNYSATLMAIANGVGSVGGAIAPLLENCNFNNEILKQLRTVICLACTILMSGEVQRYNDPGEMSETKTT